MHLKNIILIIALQLINGSTFAQEVPVRKVENAPQEDMIYDIVDEPADFPGGVVALKKYMAENLRYPQMAVENELQGKCYLQFIVTETGEITNIKVKKGVPNCPECDKEAIRLVKSMPKWIPGKKKGKAVDSTFTLPGTFRLN